MIERLILALCRHDKLTADDKRVLQGLPERTASIAAKTVVIQRGAEVRQSVILLDGFVCRYKYTREGRRQISAIHVPGDFVDLHGYTLKYLDHDVAALSEIEVAFVPHSRLDRITRDLPHLTRVLWSVTNRDAARHREWEFSLGVRSGLAAIANIFCELHARLETVRLTTGDGFALPINQTELGECTGMTNVHVNRLLKELRESGLADFRDQFVSILDLERLRAVAGFDPLYLYLN